MIRLLTTLVVALIGFADAVPGHAQSGSGAYSVAGGTYQAKLPTGWDGRTALPMLVFFHGYRQQGATVLGQDDLMAAFDRHGALVIAPDGLEGSWAHQGSPSTRRDETAFLDALLADVARRWPIDPARRWASGFSQGGSMAWHATCFRGRSFTAFFPVSGAFWRPHPDACPGGPVNLLHTHGSADTVVPMAGRPIGQTFRQGDVREGLRFWAGQNGCAAAPTRSERVGQLACEIWSPCASRRDLRLCLHPDGHMIPDGWAEYALHWAEGLAAR